MSAFITNNILSASFFLPDGSHAKSINAGMIVGLTVGVLVIVIAAGVFYRYVKFRKAKAYRRSVFRYETK